MGLLREMLGAALTLHECDDRTKPSINAHETHTEVAEVSFSWDEVDFVRAYKIDLVTTDEVRILVSFGSSEKPIELSEEQEGFEAFIRIAERKFSFPDGWWDRLTKPAFATSDTTLFHR